MKNKSILVFIGLLIIPMVSFACPECERNQPELLKGITHGAGPSGNVDYIIIWTAAVFVIATLILSIKYLVKPKENNPNHIKNLILNKD